MDHSIYLIPNNYSLQSMDSQDWTTCHDISNYVITGIKILQWIALVHLLPQSLFSPNVLLSQFGLNVLFQWKLDCTKHRCILISIHTVILWLLTSINLTNSCMNCNLTDGEGVCEWNWAIFSSYANIASCPGSITRKYVVHITMFGITQNEFTESKITRRK